MHYSLKGTDQNKNKFKFPYKTLSPLKRNLKTYNSVDDVYDELVEAYLKTEDKSKIGASLYLVHLYICNSDMILDVRSQNIIKAYLLAKDLNTPIFSNLMETPMNYIQKFQIIKEALMAYQKEEQNNVE